ncbi:GNAT family N-acetyltransferase [Ruegeria sp. 2012CJ41-6]|uniref:GNAT family N-acetyltransferase n=1 Tax=Ruegeria spongiae TaxID=2942209 RepID=A0ABT0PX12_9RHOB|nr:GNAT family N-acetyltransferase [Ruegeria spongiae]MCL6282123.1 GNAT family N-acetyltransferase [Ruegeria spongiae]
MNIRPLRRGEHKLIGAIIGESFTGDPVNEFLLGPQPAITAFNVYVARELYLKHGFGHVAEDHSAGTMWLPPGVSKHIAFHKMLPTLAALLRHSGPRRLIRALPADDEFARHRPKEPHFYLYAIGTTLAGRGKGMGGKLLKAGLEQADKAGLPAYLESSKEENIGFYRNYGFEVTGTCHPVEGCPKEWLMWRPAQ